MLGPDSARASSRMAAQGNDGRETPMICSPTCSDRYVTYVCLIKSKIELFNLFNFYEHTRSSALYKKIYFQFIILIYYFEVPLLIYLSNFCPYHNSESSRDINLKLHWRIDFCYEEYID